MSEIIFQIITHSTTLKAKHKNQRERKREKKSTVIVYKEKARKKEHRMKSNRNERTYQDFDGLLNSLEKNFWVIALIGARDVDWLVNDWEELDRGFGRSSSVFVLSDDSVVVAMVSVVDRQANECGRVESTGEEFADDEEDFRW